MPEKSSRWLGAAARIEEASGERPVSGSPDLWGPYLIESETNTGEHESESKCLNPDKPVAQSAVADI